MEAAKEAEEAAQALADVKAAMEAEALAKALEEVDLEMEEEIEAQTEAIRQRFGARRVETRRNMLAYFASSLSKEEQDYIDM
jgi:hypothetical protein